MNIDFHLKKMGLTRRKLAKMMDTTDVTIYRWEKGIHEPGHDELRKLSQLLDCSIDDLLNPPPPSASTAEEASGAERRTA